jgi:hypothetical protein
MQLFHLSSTLMRSSYVLLFAPLLLLSCSPVMCSSYALLLRAPLMRSSYALLLCAPFMSSTYELFSCAPILSYTYVLQLGPTPKSLRAQLQRITRKEDYRLTHKHLAFRLNFFIWVKTL